ncbi:MAG TPA: hypothetical protein VK794_14535 [Steroidobacteraceae bacterium]|jgi:hypothetical protein|nr:hypothetical protein [Steroidobacteraceae bacterium]
MNISGRLISTMLSLSLPFIAVAGEPAPHLMTMSAVDQNSPLVEKVRKATAQFKDINAALAAGFAQATPCVSGPDFGAMGVHFVLGSRITAGTLNATEPEALIYEPLPNGALRLVGVEFIILAQVWQTQIPKGSTATPELEGHLMNFVDFPNRYGLPAFYELHVWAWEHNPVGSFADWNTQVSCDQQATS